MITQSDKIPLKISYKMSILEKDQQALDLPGQFPDSCKINDLAGQGSGHKRTD